MSTVSKLGLAAGLVLAVSASSALAHTTASQREYKRGYRDCLAGRYDQNQHGASYKKGCRAAEDQLAKKKKKKVDECPSDVTEADRANYPGCN